MSTNDLEQFIQEFRSDIANASMQDYDFEHGASTNRENVFSKEFLSRLEDRSAISGYTLCHFEKIISKKQSKISAWNYDELDARVDIFISHFMDNESVVKENPSAIRKSYDKCKNAIELSMNDFYEKIEPSNPAIDFFTTIAERKKDLSKFKIVVYTDCSANKLSIADCKIGKIDIQFELWDISRLFRLCSSETPYESVKIDALKYGESIKCLKVPKDGADYEAYLSIIPGSFLSGIYHEYGSKLMELNVRSFLQAKGKVNRGIRETILKDRTKFLAYNNGITATVEEITTSVNNGILEIKSLTGLQIVNGGQTVASIHRANKVDSADLSNVYVQAKIIKIKKEFIQDLVPKISAYSNTQNKVSDADLQSNQEFHIELERLSRTIWAPGELSKWFYERARGQYQVARSHVKKPQFDTINPASQCFDKVALAKFCNSWDQYPFDVSQGNQKNCTKFISKIWDQHGKTWKPDRSWYCHAVAKALIYKSAEQIASELKIPAYRAQTVAYTVALLSYQTLKLIDLDRIWQLQEVPEGISLTFRSWIPKVHKALCDSCGGGNIGEWCKKKEAWAVIQNIGVSVSERLRETLRMGEGTHIQPASNSSLEEAMTIAKVMKIDSKEWVKLYDFLKDEPRIRTQLTLKTLTTIIGFSNTGWSQKPTINQCDVSLRAYAIGVSNKIFDDTES